MNTTRALPELNILSHYPEGVGDTDVADPSKSLEVLIGPLLLSQQDRLDLFWGNSELPVDSYIHSPDAPNTNGIFSLYVDPRWIQSGTTHVRYIYTPYPANIPEPSPIKTVTVKLSIPGGRDPDPESPYENEKLPKPAVNPPGVIISPDGVSVTVLPWENMSEGDLLSVYWHGLQVRVPALQLGQVGHPVVVDIPREVVIEAGDSENIVVRYDIRDVVNNWSRFSLPTYVEAEAGNSTLPAPIAPQAPNMELDLDKLGGAGVQALVLANANIGIGDIIQFTVERNTAEGIALQPYTDTRQVSIPGSFVEFLIPNEQFQPIAQGRARLKYVVRKASGEQLRSKSLPLSILSRAQELALPVVPAAVNGLLDPTLRKVIAQVPAYHFMADGHDVTLVWRGKTASGSTVVHEEVKNLNQADVGKTLEFLIPDEKVITLAGGTLEVNYTVSTFAKEFFKSPVLHLLVDTDHNDLLPAPQVDKVNEEGVLDPDDVVLEAVVRVLPYQAMAVGDRVAVHWDGRNADGSYNTYTVINSGTVNKEVIFRVPRSFVIANLNGSIDVWYDVQRGGRTSASVKQRISIRQTAPAPLPTPTVKEAQGNQLDPALAPYGATAQVAASADLRVGDRVTMTWQGPKGSDSKEKTIAQDEAGKPLALLFAYALVIANAGQTVAIAYTVNRVNGQVQTSETLNLHILDRLDDLPAPSMDTVGADGVLDPARIPESGATVRVRYPGMSSDDRVVVNWRGAVHQDTPEQSVGNQPELLFKLPKALILASIGSTATLGYTVTRAGRPQSSAPLWLTVRQGLSLDTRPVTLDGKVYLLPGTPDLLPNMPAGTTVQRTASGGQAPYTYSTSNPLVAKVDGNGLVTARGKGIAHITATDSRGEKLSYQVTVTGVIHALGLGNGSVATVVAAATQLGARLCSIHELRELHTAYGSRWPMGNALYWSSTVAQQNLAGWQWFFLKNLVTGTETNLLHHKPALGVGLR
ncbi:Ig-like domain-containing protein [Pseudomonas sp. 21LCFQ02]|uniref:Ig-like domain-containing protein n=1 Tax=Pseudomonas sp. 21LCFQ02 TaxID=2957505 RepID=UPI00209B7A51|nr:Ig-like domain-containing protein [Pseudomonas sp. 21LCFQ02]MCO8170083.1 Ig-like domain-containing protein [Pseudomonas sp. 21LCFQ02]